MKCDSIQPTDNIAKSLSATFNALPFALATALFGCSQGPEDRIQSQLDTPSPDGTHIATVQNKVAEDTTGTIPQLLLRRAGGRATKAAPVLEGAMNSSFQISWTSTNQLLVEYSSGEGNPHLPATTNLDGITITFRPQQSGGEEAGQAK